MKKAFGKDLPRILGRQLRNCPQCGGVGWDDNMARVARCVRCSGSGIVKTGLAEPADEVAAEGSLAGPDLPEPPRQPEETPLGSEDLKDFDDSMIEAVLSDEVPIENNIPPQQLKSDIAAMLSSSFVHTIEAVFEHVAGLDTEMTGTKRANYVSKPQDMLFYVYKRLDVMTPEQLKSTFRVFRK